MEFLANLPRPLSMIVGTIVLVACTGGAAYLTYKELTNNRRLLGTVKR